MAQLETLRNSEGKVTGYRVVWREGGRGSKKLRTPKIETKEKALEALDRIEAEQAAKAPMRQGIALPIVELLERWRSDRVGNGNDATFSKMDSNRLLVQRELRGWTLTTDVSPEAVMTWKKSTTRVKGNSSLWRAFLTWCRDYAKQPVDAQTLIALRPGRKVNSMQTGRLLTREEVDALQAKAAAISPDCEALVHCLSTYGWRPITAAKLKVSDVDLDEGTIVTQVKGRKVIKHPLHPISIKMLTPLIIERQPDDPLFLDPRTGKAFSPVNGYNISMWSRDHLKEKVYNLKRFAITTLLDARLDVATIMLFTGHSTAKQVYEYARTNENKAREALLQFPVAAQPKKPKKPKKVKAAVGHHGAPAKTPVNKATAHHAKKPVKAPLRITA